MVSAGCIHSRQMANSSCDAVSPSEKASLDHELEHCFARVAYCFLVRLRYAESIYRQ
jgi:hypothetical protein